MAMSTTTAIALALAAASSAASYYNTQRTANRQDAAAADSIRNQSRRQRDADAKVAAEVQRLEASNSAAERQKAMKSFSQQLRTNRKAIDSGLVQGYGSDAFREAGEKAQQSVGNEAEQSASLLSRMDAPAYQRLNEGFSRGMLSTDIAEIARGAQGQEFLDRLRINAIRRNPWIDAGASMAGAMSGNLAGAGTMAGSGGTSFGPYASGYRYPGGG